MKNREVNSVVVEAVKGPSVTHHFLWKDQKAEFPAKGYIGLWSVSSKHTSQYLHMLIRVA